MKQYNKLDLPLNKQYFAPLTGIRAVAATMVCIFHFNPFTKARFGSIIHDFFNEFHVGVAMFFVLSGFLITYRYYDIPKIDLKKYFVNRFARIYPVYFLFTTLIIVSNYFFFKNQPPTNFYIEYFLNITFLKGLFDNFKFSGILQGWTLTVEEMFYIIAPFSFLLIKRNKIAIIILPLFIFISGFLLIWIFQDVHFYGFLQNAEFVISYTFFGRVFEFFIGIALAIVFIQYPNLYSQRRKKTYFTFWGIVTCTLCIFWISILKENVSFGIRHPIGKLINNFILPLFGIATLYLGLISENTIISRILSSKIFIILGKSSYTFYLIHIWVSKINSNFLFVLIITYIISTFVYKYIEEPTNQIIRKTLI